MTANRVDWRKVCYVTLPLLAVLLVGAFFALTFSEEVILGNLGVVHETVYPYQTFGIAFAVLGCAIALIPLGSYLTSRRLALRK